MAEPTPAVTRAAEKCWEHAAYPHERVWSREKLIAAFAEIIEQETGHRELLAVCDAARLWLAEGQWADYRRLERCVKAVSAQQKPDIRPSEIILGDEGNAQ